jgi:hypothetical protein
LKQGNNEGQDDNLKVIEPKYKPLKLYFNKQPPTAPDSNEEAKESYEQIRNNDQNLIS